MGFVNNYLPGLNAAAYRSYRALRLYRANGSARAWRQFLSHFARRLLGRPAPAYLILAPTYRCQYRCVHCCATAHNGDAQDELNTAEVKSVIDQAQRLGVLEIIFTGGEPMLREDIVELVRHAHEAGLITRLNTNGLLLDRQRVAELKAAGLNQCDVSLDHADPEVHDRLRGAPGSHAKLLEGIRNLQGAGVFCQIVTYASKRNVTAGLEQIIDLGRNLGVLAVFVFFPVAVGRWEDNFDEVLSEEDMAKVRALQDLTFVYLELPTPRTMCCALAKSGLYVTASGDVTPCPFVPLVVGNVREHSLDELWRRYCDGMTLACRGRCPMNEVHSREALRKRIDSIAQSLMEG